MKNYTIAILGLGAVGGYVGGMLAAARIPGAKVIFITRGQTLEAIKQDGLKLVTDHGSFTCIPDLASDDPAEIGKVDLLICSVKGYDLGRSLLQYRNCLTAATVLLPLLNGIGIPEKILGILPDTAVWQGLIYVVARQIGKGVIKQTGVLREIVFGSAAAPVQAMQEVAGIFTRAGLKATVADNIDLEIWRKFLFISVMATLTCYYHSPIGDIRKDPAKAHYIAVLVGELKAVAVSCHIPITDQIADAILDRINGLPAGTTTSMYADFQKGGRTEVEELTGDVVRLGQKLRVPTPAYDLMYMGLAGQGNGVNT
ncbi:MAG TPA: 2-dehydropantoate 2-reductase [Puia sp.]|nr:2-dehydropantoate 2-reductase [Puia sp.]